MPFYCNYSVHGGAEESSNSDKWPQSFKSLSRWAAALWSDGADMWIKVKHTGLTLWLRWPLTVSVRLSRSCESVSAPLQRWLFLTFWCCCFSSLSHLNFIKHLNTTAASNEVLCIHPGSRRRSWSADLTGEFTLRRKTNERITGLDCSGSHWFSSFLLIFFL